MQHLNSVEEVLKLAEENFVPEQAKGADATVQLRIKGKGGGEWVVRIHDGQMTITPGTVEEPDLFFETSVKNFFALVNRELDPMKAYILRKVRFEGSKTLAFHLATMFRMPE